MFRDAILYQLTASVSGSTASVLASVSEATGLASVLVSNPGAWVYCLGLGGNGSVLASNPGASVLTSVSGTSALVTTLNPALVRRMPRNDATHETKKVSYCSGEPVTTAATTPPGS